MITSAPSIDMMHFILRLGVAALCGFFIGFERQLINRVAGIQTNALVCIGSCVFVLSSYFVGYEGQSASRIAAQVVSGVGFLGAGMIFRDGFNTHGVNTAATLWCAAATGVLCGMGLLAEAGMVVLTLIIINTILRKLDLIISKNRKIMDNRIFRRYEIQVISPKENGREIRMKAIRAINVEDHYIYSVKTEFMKNDMVKFIICFNTHHMTHDYVESTTEKIEELLPDLIVDWSQLQE